MVQVLQQNTWINDRKFLKSCVRAGAEQDNINHPAYGTWTAVLMLWGNESKAFLGKYLNDPCVPWRHKRREMMAIAGTIPVAKWLAKIKQRREIFQYRSQLSLYKQGPHNIGHARPGTPIPPTENTVNNYEPKIGRYRWSTARRSKIKFVNIAGRCRLTQK